MKPNFKMNENFYIKCEAIVVMEFMTSEIDINTVNNNWHGDFCAVTLAERSRKISDVEIKKKRHIIK